MACSVAGYRIYIFFFTVLDLGFFLPLGTWTLHLRDFGVVFCDFVWGCCVLCDLGGVLTL